MPSQRQDVRERVRADAARLEAAVDEDCFYWPNLHIETLVELYHENGMSYDRLTVDQEALERFVRWLNGRIGTDYDAKQVCHLMLWLGSQGKLPAPRGASRKG